MSPWAPAGFDRALCLLAPLAQGGLQTVPFLNSRPRAPLFLSFFLSGEATFLQPGGLLLER